jgi:colanic acid/amylovoran biosynthesis glycosyltransferase
MDTNTENQNHPRIAYLYVTFPSPSETFLQREMRVIREKTPHLRLYSLWGGNPQFEGQKILRFSAWELFSLLYWLPFWMLLKPKTVCAIFISLITHRPRYLKNLGETLLGHAFALVRARSLLAWNTEWVHAVWATMPATAALSIQRLVGIPFSMGGHAYDLFQKGGDCLLPFKINEASFIHCSTDMARKHLVNLGANPLRVHLIRRGLSSFPPTNLLRDPIDSIRILTVGRLVEKKGYLHQMLIYRELRKRGIAFEVEILGDGPLKRDLAEMIEDFGLAGRVKLIGAVPHDRIQKHYEWADLFVFTGVVAANGDRNGLANVIPEAMSRGIPVITTPDEGILENFESERELVILPLHPIDPWVNEIRNLASDTPRRKALSQRGKAWVEQHFSAIRNAGMLFDLMEAAVLRQRSKNADPMSS